MAVSNDRYNILSIQIPVGYIIIYRYKIIYIYIICIYIYNMYTLPVYIKDHTDNGIFVYIYLKSKLIE